MPGNHDAFGAALRRRSTFGGIDVCARRSSIVTADGRRLRVIHGDVFDGVIQCAPWLAPVGRVAYDAARSGAQPLVERRSRATRPALLVAVAVPEAQGQEAPSSYISDFEDGGRARGAPPRRRRRRVRPHPPAPRSARHRRDVLYCNDGDWVESCTALVEHHDGRLEIVRWTARPTTAEPEGDGVASRPDLAPRSRGPTLTSVGAGRRPRPTRGHSKRPMRRDPLRVLFAVQGEGRGHLTQALATAAMLRRRGHHVVGAMAGTSRWATCPTSSARASPRASRPSRAPASWPAATAGSAPSRRSRHSRGCGGSRQPRPDLGRARPARARRRRQLLRGADGAPRAPPRGRRARRRRRPPVLRPPGLLAPPGPAAPAARDGGVHALAGAGARRGSPFSFYDAPDRPGVRVAPPLLRSQLFASPTCRATGRSSSTSWSRRWRRPRDVERPEPGRPAPHVRRRRAARPQPVADVPRAERDRLPPADGRGARRRLHGRVRDSLRGHVARHAGPPRPHARPLRAALQRRRRRGRRRRRPRRDARPRPADRVPRPSRRGGPGRVRRRASAGGSRGPRAGPSAPSRRPQGWPPSAATARATGGPTTWRSARPRPPRRPSRAAERTGWLRRCRLNGPVEAG